MVPFGAEQTGDLPDCHLTEPLARAFYLSAALGWNIGWRSLAESPCRGQYPGRAEQQIRDAIRIANTRFQQPSRQVVGVALCQVRVAYDN